MAPAVIVGMESQDMATLMTEHLTNFLRISSLPSKCKLISRHGYRSLSWCMNGGEEECECEQMTHPLSAVSGRGLLRGASICGRIYLILSSTPWDPNQQCSRLGQELVKMPSLKSRSILVSGGHRLLNLVSVESGIRCVAEYFIWS